MNNDCDIENIGFLLYMQEQEKKEQQKSCDNEKDKESNRNK